MIEVTVGLPMYRAQDIGWVALESLCRQKETEGIEWELIVAEERFKEFLPFEKYRVMSYKERLKEVGCQRIEYITLDEWIMLSTKWKIIGEHAFSMSKIFLLQAADCFSQPYRIRETYDLMQDANIDWIQSPKGLFYSIPDNTTALFNADLRNRQGTALNMATRTCYIRNLPIIKGGRTCGFDNWMFRSCTSLKGSDLLIVWNESENWKYGVDIHGLNNLSKGRADMMKEFKVPFEKTDINIKDYLPSDIVDEIDKRKKLFK